MSKSVVFRLKVILFLLCLLPAILLTWRLFTNQLGANPIEAVTRSSGLWALRFLIITLMVSPLRWFTGIQWLVRFRRMSGLFAFFYATVHMLLYLGLDQFFDWSEIWRDIMKRPFITIGFISFASLLPLAITSNNSMIKRLGGKNWQRLHQLIYIIAPACGLHFLMLVKADIRTPLIYLAIIIFLLSIRLFRYWQRVR